MMGVLDPELLDQVLDGVASVFLVVGGLMSLAAGIGMVRFPDLHSRMHAATKPQVLGLLSLLMAAAITWRSWTGVVLVLLAWGLQLLTAPASAHVVGRAGYRTKHFKAGQLAQDELARAVDRISRGHGARREVRDESD
ncbi:monovalent cation/H(+) antiporter subunit G [Nesterenkonia sp. CL21]|uniref:monovalent cation/H(+) antiporter subunit G n=1 Tax=unclassified Nesterenkonia TaxID=2629769 RepID=UPI00287A8337|nr:monovalent cation/H(+) antiporter subunit G [Nesterenkonia sp. CL21]MDS2172939.1 monovalent cation/H(+) antiporter subunit G [Nesterenkonia sp. CL21]